MLFPNNNKCHFAIMLISSFALSFVPQYLITLIVRSENVVSSYGVLCMDVCSKNVNLFFKQINK
jgi:hypothetical protein